MPEIKILFHSNAPWATTGYGQQTALVTPRIKAAGHDVYISAFHGLAGAPSMWEGMHILPGGYDPYGNDILGAHARAVQADLVLAHMDAWVLNPDQLRGFKVANWAPVDCDPMSVMDHRYFQASGAIPIAVSKFGERVFKEAGFTPLYVPHAIDTSVFVPPDDRMRIRREISVPEDVFIIGMNAANKDAVRKSFPEQFLAFKYFHEKHPDSLMMVHAMTQAPQALNLMDVVNRLGIRDHVRFSDPYNLITGNIRPQNLAAWYGAIDVLSACSHAEGFGIPIVEAQSCGTPVIVTNFSSMPELCGAGWQVDGEPFWNAPHSAWWRKPHIEEIADAYEKAYNEAPALRAAAREFALGYDVNTIFATHWIPALRELADS